MRTLLILQIKWLNGSENRRPPMWRSYCSFPLKALHPAERWIKCAPISSEKSAKTWLFAAFNGFRPRIALSAADVPAELIERERSIARQKAAESNKPAAIIEKMVEGSVQKYLKEI